MGYQLNGVDITRLCETAWGSGDSRGKSDFNTSKYYFNGGTRADQYPNSQFISYASGFAYSQEGLKGKFSGFPTFIKAIYQASARGYRPYSKNRYSSTTVGQVFINKFHDGEVWISSLQNSRTGIKICTQQEDYQYAFVCCAGGGGGGGGGGPLASAGGGGGGAYAFMLIKLQPERKITASVGKAGTAGGKDKNGISGGDTNFLLWEYNGGPATTAYIRGGKGGENSAGGGGAGGDYYYTTGREELHFVAGRNGASGGSRNNAGGNSTINFTNYTPEKETITYLTGLGGASGGSSGGGGGGGSPLGNGGAGGASSGANGGNGMICAGGGGGAWQAFGSTSGGSGGTGYFAFYY